MNTEFYKPSNISSAVELMGRYGSAAVVVNGGTDIVLAITEKRVRPQALVYVKDVDELQGIRLEGEQLVIGGAVTYLSMQKSPMCMRVRGLKEAVSRLGSPPVRAQGTPAGNLATAAPSADCATMLMALDTTILLESAAGQREVPIGEFYIARGKTAIKSDEIIREIRVPAPREGLGTGYFRVARRKAQDIGKALCGVSVVLENGVCTYARVSLGALNAVAVRASSVEQALVGKNRVKAMEYVNTNFPPEAGLRDSYFKHYKELVTKEVIARALDMAWNDASGVPA